jgi:cell division protein FtsB
MTFVNPSSLSLPSPPSSDSPSAAAGPSRTRARTDTVTPDDRKEARAHRNRIAAQNSRDKRKAQFSYLERRVTELEEENRQLRAGVVVDPHHRQSAFALDAPKLEEKKAWEKENDELKERIKSLEKGWDAVVKALAAQGLTTGINAPPPPPSSSPECDTSPSPTNTTTFPVLVPPSTILPLSPALSHTSSMSSLFSDEFEFESTRHLARVATIEAPPPSMSLQRVDSPHERITSASTPPPPPPQSTPPLCRPSRTAPETTPRWKTSFARSSRIRLPHRRRLFLLSGGTLPPRRCHRWLLPLPPPSHPRR